MILEEAYKGMKGLQAEYISSRLSDLMPEKYKFNGRSKNPAKDEFNCMLNYGYGIMYSNVERACILAGLDPYIGIMHVDNYNRQAFVFDLIEMYRIYIDKIVFKLFTTKKVKKEHFDKVEGGLYLNKAGKEILISKYNCKVNKCFLVYTRSSNLIKELKKLKKDIRDYFKVMEGYFPKATSSKARCIDCCYRNICIK